MIASTTWNPGTTINSSMEYIEVTVPGARPGDFAFCSFDAHTDDTARNTNWTACVSADDTVTVAFTPDPTAPTFGAGTVRVKVVPYESI